MSQTLEETICVCVCLCLAYACVCVHVCMVYDVWYVVWCVYCGSCVLGEGVYVWCVGLCGACGGYVDSHGEGLLSPVGLRGHCCAMTTSHQLSWIPLQKRQNVESMPTPPDVFQT